MADKKEEGKALATTQTQLPAHFTPDLLQSYAGQGMEEAGVEDFAIPFLNLLQKMSPQVDSDAAEYVEGAKVGMFMNSVTKQLFGGEKGVRVIPVHFEKCYVEWVKRDAGGGWVATHLTREAADKNQDRERETEIVDTANHYVLLEVAPDEWEPVVLACTSTKLRASREWMSAMSRVIVSGPGGKFVAPTFSKVWTIRSISQQKDKFTYYNIVPTLEEGWAPQEQFEKATKFREQVLSGTRGAKFEEVQLADAELVHEDGGEGRPSF